MMLTACHRPRGDLASSTWKTWLARNEVAEIRTGIVPCASKALVMDPTNGAQDVRFTGLACGPADGLMVERLAAALMPLGAASSVVSCVT